MVFSAPRELLERTIHCPCCGEPIDVLVDVSEPLQNYVEDCQVCCRPINFDVEVDAHGDAVVRVASESE